jgi:hypothetical protein
MRTRWNRVAVWVVVYGIALQSILAPISLPTVQAANIDPYTVICHSDGQDSDTPGSQPGFPAQTCDHCVLCNVTLAAAPPGLASHAAPLVSRSEPLPDPATTLPLSTSAKQKLPRGPPQVA